jgi:PAS domain S-box-containing protein
MGSGMNLMARDSRGNEFPVDVMLWPFDAGSAQCVLAVCRRFDVSLANTQTKIYDLVESGRDCAINLLDAQGRILTWSEGSLRIYNMTASEALGQNYSILFTRAEIAAGEPARQLEEASRSSESFCISGWRLGADGEEIWAEIELSAVRDNSGQFNGFVRVLHDMTSYKRAESILREANRVQGVFAAVFEKRVAERTQQLKSALEELRGKNEEIETFAGIISRDLREKEILLREVYHRVKNNLQVVQSLLKMGARYLPAGNAQAAIETAIQRVHVMAMVHERLYQTKDLTGISLPMYLHDVAGGAIASNTVRPEQIALELDAEEISLTLDQAIPFGLLAHELVLNCIKHGFPNGRPGKIHFSIHRIPGAARVVVSDDGVGLPDNFDATKLTSMGLKLAASLAHQLGGHLEFTSDHGCRVQAELTRLGQ